MSNFKGICATLASLMLCACATSPTGRNQMLLYSEGEMSQLGAQSFVQMKSEITATKDAKKIAYVQCIVDALLPYVPAQSSFEQWEVVVFESDQVNAFALPGGKIGVYTGIMKVAENQHQLAAVIGHEIVHVTAQHGNERMSQSQLTNTGLSLSNLALGNNQYREVAMSALGLGVQYGVLMPYGRSQESEADIIGLEIMAKAGFDPNASITLWQNMGKASKGKQPAEFFSTHPSNATRIQNLQNKIKQLPNYQTKAPNCDALL